MLETMLSWSKTIEDKDFFAYSIVLHLNIDLNSLDIDQGKIKPPYQGTVHHKITFISFSSFPNSDGKLSVVSISIHAEEAW